MNADVLLYLLIVSQDASIDQVLFFTLNYGLVVAFLYFAIVEDFFQALVLIVQGLIFRGLKDAH